MSTGLVHLYVGDGKGKTTAAIGLGVRAIGAGKKVVMVQFLKGLDSCELEPLKKLGFEIARTDEIKKFVFQMSKEEITEAKQSCDCCVNFVRTNMKDQTCDVIILDEVVDAVNCGLVEVDALIELIKSREDNIEVVMTGRNPKDLIIEISDYLTVMTALKHPYNKGIQSRRGIEF